MGLAVLDDIFSGIKLRYRQIFIVISTRYVEVLEC